MERPSVEICCIASVEEVNLAIHYGAGAIGLVSAMPRGPGPIPEDCIACIIAGVPPLVSTFLLTSRQDAASIIAQQKRTLANTLQLVDRVERDCLRELRAALPAVKLVQVIHITGPETVEDAASVAAGVDALLLDSEHPWAPVKELGGTGRTTTGRSARESGRRLTLQYFSRADCGPGTCARRLNGSGPSGSIFAVACARMDTSMSRSPAFSRQ